MSLSGISYRKMRLQSCESKGQAFFHANSKQYPVPSLCIPECLPSLRIIWQSWQISDCAVCSPSWITSPSKEITRQRTKEYQQSIENVLAIAVDIKSAPIDPRLKRLRHTFFCGVFIATSGRSRRCSAERASGMFKDRVIDIGVL